MKLNPIGDIPPARAAHAACAIDHNHLAIFGGTCLQGALAPDKNSSIWYKVPNDGSGPGKRYGHSLIYYKNYLLIFGGSFGNSLTNKVHFTQIENNLRKIYFLTSFFSSSAYKGLDASERY